MKTLNKVKTSIWINALSAIIIGILFLINPQESFQMITIIAGIIITATGILDFIYYFNGWLDIYFSGKNPDFTPKYKIENLTPFRSQVIDIMNKIPYGKTVTYNDIAKEIAQNRGIEKMSAQAVGGAVGWNPICIIVPCHRVVGTNGSLTGYGGGIQNKVKLLEIENNDMSKFTIPKKGTAL